MITDQLPGPLTRPENSGPVGSFTYRNPQSLDVVVQRDSPGLLVVSQAWTPGWQAELDGNAVPVYRVDHALLGVYLPSGDHEVRLRYDPLGWRWGWRITAGSLMVLLLARLISRARYPTRHAATSLGQTA